MKKKILSTLLAVAMFASVAVPAFASETSTQEGDPAKITMLEFRKDGKLLESLDIKEDEEVDLRDYLMAWEDKDTLVLDKNQINWEIRDTQSRFTLTGSELIATEPNGSATVIARDGESGKVVAKLTVNAKPNDKETYANSWKFASSNYDVVYDNGSVRSEGLTIKVSPVPAGSILTDANINRINTEVARAITEAGIIADVAAVRGSNAYIIADVSEVTNFEFGGDNVVMKARATGKATTPNSVSTKFDVLATDKERAEAVVELVNESNFVVTVNKEEVTFTAELGEKDGWVVLKANSYIKGLNKETALNFFPKDCGVVIRDAVEGEERDEAAAAALARDVVSEGKLIVPSAVNGDGDLVYEVPAQYLTQKHYEDNFKEGEKVSVVAETTNFGDRSDNNYKKVKSQLNLKIKKAVSTTKVSVLPNKTIEVGETFKLGDTLGYGPSNANVDKKITGWYEAALNDNASVVDYAIVNNDGVVTGVKTGKNRIYVQLESGHSAYCTVTVVPKGTIDKVDDHNAVLKVKDVTVTVGGTQWIDMYNIDADSIVKWTSSDEAIAKIVGNSENKGAKVWGLKEGTATLTLTVDGDVAATLNVTVKGAATTPSKPDATGNAQTGDTLFSNLF